MTSETRHKHHPKAVHHRQKQPLISIEMVSKTYSEDLLDFKTLVLKNVYIQIFEGEFVAIFGPSGSGKSTLLNLIAGLESPTAGRVLVRRRDLSKLNNDQLAQFHRSKMGFVFQSFNLIKSLNVWENVALPQTAQGVPVSERKVKAMRLLKLLHVDQYANRQPNELSGGEQQRVAIARALINDPYFLIVDEPTGNLDSKSADAVMNILKDIHTQDKHTIVLVTHNPAQLQYATRVIYIQDGQVVIEENREQGVVGQALDTDSTGTTATPGGLKEDDTLHFKIIGETKKAKPSAEVPAPPAEKSPPLREPAARVIEKPVAPPVNVPLVAPQAAPAEAKSAVPQADPHIRPIPVAKSEPPRKATPIEMPNSDVIKTVYIKGEGD